MLLTDFDALTFDCYGTLIDWESGMVEALKALTDRAQRPLTRDQILEAHARHESSQQRYTPAKRYRDLLAIVYKRLAEEWGVHATHEDCVQYGRFEIGLRLKTRQARWSTSRNTSSSSSFPTWTTRLSWRAIAGCKSSSMRSTRRKTSDRTSLRPAISTT